VRLSDPAQTRGEMQSAKTIPVIHCTSMSGAKSRSVWR
jgi:hypothetical protein